MINQCNVYKFCIMDLGGARGGADEAEIERGRGRKNVNSLGKKSYLPSCPFT